MNKELRELTDLEMALITGGTETVHLGTVEVGGSPDYWADFPWGGGYDSFPDAGTVDEPSDYGGGGEPSGSTGSTDTGSTGTGMTGTGTTGTGTTDPRYPGIHQYEP